MLRVSHLFYAGSSWPWPFIGTRFRGLPAIASRMTLMVWSFMASTDIMEVLRMMYKHQGGGTDAFCYPSCMLQQTVKTQEKLKPMDGTLASSQLPQPMQISFPVLSSTLDLALSMPGLKWRAAEPRHASHKRWQYCVLGVSVSSRLSLQKLLSLQHGGE
ncbi:unnamed protein product [Effrenium voratum]|nr:unnamed protein product [Effrenium voratum]CAJ1432705.1 unnamed protein product [Effrenium voratum]